VDRLAQRGQGRAHGHSVGAELAFKLVCEHESLFSRAVFLSPWLMAGSASTKLYVSMARMTYKSIKNEKLIRMQAKYWKLSPEQADAMVAYSQKIPLDTYVSFFEKRIHFSDEPGYESVSIPMLACAPRATPAKRRLPLPH
jgi:hypothetical protein